MTKLIHILLIVALAIAAIHLILSVEKTNHIRVISIDEDFTVRFPRVFLYICIVFFLLAAVVVINMILYQRFLPFHMLFIIIFSALTLPFLLLSFVWKIEVRSEYMVYVSLWGVKRQIYYKDISSASLYPTTLFLQTTLKNYRIYPQVTYREYFLKRLSMNGVKISRFQQ